MNYACLFDYYRNKSYICNGGTGILQGKRSSSTSVSCWVCPDSSAAFHAVMVRGLMLNHHDATVGLIRDQIGWHAFRVKTKDGNRLAKCRLLPSLLSYLLQCVDFLFYGLGIIKLH